MKSHIQKYEVAVTRNKGRLVWAPRFDVCVTFNSRTAAEQFQKALRDNEVNAAINTYTIDSIPLPELR